MDELKAQLRIVGSEEDTRVELIGRAAEAEYENETGRKIIRETLEVRLDCFADEITLPAPPFVSVTSIKYIDPDGAEQTLSTDVYDSGSRNSRGRIWRKFGEVWPAIRGEVGAVRIQFVAGYAATTAAVSERVKHGILMRATELYDPDDAAAGMAADRLAAQNSINHF